MEQFYKFTVVPPSPVSLRHYNWQLDWWQNVDPYEIYGVKQIPIRYSDGWEAFSS